MLQLRLFKDRLFRSTNIAMFAASGSLIGLLFLLPLFLQELRGLSAVESGLATFPQAIGFMLMARIAGRAYPKLGPDGCWSSVSRSAVITTGFVFVDLDTSLWVVRFLHARARHGHGVRVHPRAGRLVRHDPAERNRPRVVAVQHATSGRRRLRCRAPATILSTRDGPRGGRACPHGDIAVLSARVTAFHQAMFASAVLTAAGIIATAVRAGQRRHLHDAAGRGRGRRPDGTGRGRPVAAIAPCLPG